MNKAVYTGISAITYCAYCKGNSVQYRMRQADREWWQCENRHNMLDAVEATVQADAKPWYFGIPFGNLHFLHSKLADAHYHAARRYIDLASHGTFDDSLDATCKELFELLADVHTASS
jgi:hypothetical protein